MPFFSVNFDLKTKMPSTVINKKNIKINILKKKLKENGWLPPPQRWPEPPLGVARGPATTSGVAVQPPQVLGRLCGHPFSLRFFFFYYYYFIKTRVFRSFLKLS
jgi:hypothetical protein